MDRQILQEFIEKILDIATGSDSVMDVFQYLRNMDIRRLKEEAELIVEAFSDEDGFVIDAAKTIASLAMPPVDGPTATLYRGVKCKPVYVVDSDGYFSQGWRLNPSRVQKRLDSYDDGKHSGDTDPFDAPGVTSAEEELIAALSDTRNQLKAAEAQILKLTGKLRKVAEIIPDFLD
jgi:hypothetical protein